MPADEFAIISLLPYLRRYARALTGSQKRGDTYVRLCLETVLEEPLRLQGGKLKVLLFKVFHEAWQAVDTRTVAFGEAAQSAVQRRDRGLAALPSVQRQILLLTRLEEFSLSEAASIVGLDAATAEELLEQATREVQLVSSVPILIIEDEPMIALEIARIVRDMGHRVCGTAARQSEAVELAARTRPELILADIQLKGAGSGITAVQEILKAVEVPIIFVTGYPERLLTGEDLEPAFVIPKPFSAEMLRAAIGQALTVVAKDASSSDAA